MTEFDVSSYLYDYRYAIGNLAGWEMSVLFVINQSQAVHVWNHE